MWALSPTLGTITHFSSNPYSRPRSARISQLGGQHSLGRLGNLGKPGRIGKLDKLGKLGSLHRIGRIGRIGYL